MAKTRNFVYYQPNDKDIKDDYDDCVIRALCKAMNKTWLEVFDILMAKARKLQAPAESKPTYTEVLSEHGFKYYGVSNAKGTKRPTVKQHAAKSKEPCVMVVANHLVACQDGKFYDTWDSGEKSLYGYWVKEA